MLVVREETYDSGITRYGDDWLDLCLPLGSLANLDKRVGAYPFSEEADSRGWREPIEGWFATVASAVFQAVPFVHAITGDEVSGVDPSEVQQGRLGVFRRSPDGSLNSEPVRTGPGIRMHATAVEVRFGQPSARTQPSLTSQAANQLISSSSGTGKWKLGSSCSTSYPGRIDAANSLLTRS